MIELISNFLIELLIPLSFILTILLVIHAVSIKKLGAKNVYFSWLSVPFGLLIFCLPLNLFDRLNGADNQIERFIFLPTQQYNMKLILIGLCLFGRLLQVQCCLFGYIPIFNFILNYV